MSNVVRKNAILCNVYYIVRNDIITKCADDNNVQVLDKSIARLQSNNKHFLILNLKTILWILQHYSVKIALHQ